MVKHNIRGVLVIILAISLVLARSDSGTAHEDSSAGEAYPLEKRYAPTPIPDRVTITWTADPARSIDVTWRTSAQDAPAIVQYFRADILRGDLRREDLAGRVEVEAVAVPFETNAGVCHMHSAHLSGLQPRTVYAYRVGDGTNWSEWYQFTTAAAEQAPFSFVYFGDAQNAIRSWWSRVVREAHRQAPRAAFMLHAGDLVNSANLDSEWGEWFEAGGWLHASIPVVATPGNHEYDDHLSRHWQPQFAFPRNGPAGLEETVYWLDYQGVRIVSLNSNERIEEQASWLEEVLADESPRSWTIVTFHHPVFSAAESRDNAELRAAWKPLFDRHRVDLVLQGHDHAYARSGLGGPRNLETGVNKMQGNTVYAVSVSGPKMYGLTDKWDFAREASGVQLYQVIHIAGNRLRYEARLPEGTLYDAFQIEKDDRQTCLVEWTPSTAEIRD